MGQSPISKSLLKLCVSVTLCEIPPHTHVRILSFFAFFVAKDILRILHVLHG